MTVYYTSSSATGGGVGSFADPWTLQEAFDGAVAGDEVRILNDGVYYPTAQIDIDTNRGTDAVNNIKFLGRSADDASYEKATISANSLSSGFLIRFGFTSGATACYLQFEDIAFDGSYAGTDQFGTADSYYTRKCKFFRCVFRNSNRYTMCAGYYFEFYQSEFIDGVSLSNFAVQWSQYANCLFKNIGAVFSAGDRTNFYGCVFIDAIASYGNPGNYFNCTFDGAGLQASAITNLSEIVCVFNCVFVNFTGTALSGFENNSLACSGNYFYNNGTNASFSLNATNMTSGGDPLFVSTTPGSENYTPQTSSLLIGAGLTGTIPYADYQAMTGYGTPGALLPRQTNQVFHPLGFGG